MNDTILKSNREWAIDLPSRDHIIDRGLGIDSVVQGICTVSPSGENIWRWLFIRGGPEVTLQATTIKF